MSQRSVLYQWNEEIRKNMTHLSKPQSKALAAFSVGIAKDERCALNAAAKKPPFMGNPATVERGIQRFIANDLLVDKTGRKDRLKAIVAGGLLRWTVASRRAVDISQGKADRWEWWS